MRKRGLPEINAGSMADIAFLLLIFFLVTTTLEIDSGILRKIPPKQKVTELIKIKEKNILEINLNRNNELFVDGKIIKISELKEIALNFIDNGAGLDANNQPCDWCLGNKDLNSSDHPSKAFISVKAARETNYETYIQVLDQLYIAYADLRNKLALLQYEETYSNLMERFYDSKNNDEELLKKIRLIREKYPLLVSDFEMTN